MATVRLHHPTKESAPAWSIRKRRPEIQALATPGPGSYRTGRLESPKACKFSKTPRGWKTDRNNIPGPGYYEDITVVTVPTSPAYTIPRIKKTKPVPRMTTPGPCTYSIPELRSGSPQMTFARPSSMEWIAEPTPGPGDYSTPRKRPSNRPNFGRQLRLRGYNTKVPGPGAYHTPDEKMQGPAYSISRGDKFSSPKRSAVSPGPGHYTTDVPKHKTGPKFIVHAQKRRCASPQPGPGHYDANITHRKSSPSFTLSYCIRTKEIKTAVQLPSPCSYDIKSKPTRHTTFARSEKGLKFADVKTPAPGAYSYQPRVKKGQRFPLSARRAKESTPTPGPCDYEPINLQSTSGSTFSPKARFTRPQPPGPAPGDYDPELGENPKTYTFSRSPRETPGFAEEEGMMLSIPASVPNAPKYLMPEALLAAYSREPINW